MGEKDGASVPFIDDVTAGRMIVIETPTDALNAVWGGIMTARAQVLDVAGVVINGRCRDLQEIQELQFPVFSSGRSCLGSTNATKVIHTNQPIHIGRVTVCSNDLIVGDVDGVMVVPEVLVDVVYDEIIKLGDRDVKIVKHVRNGMTVAKAKSQTP